jgi:hypothetical protein
MTTAAGAKTGVTIQHEKSKAQMLALHRSIDAFTDGIKSARSRFTTKKLLEKVRAHARVWVEASARLVDDDRRCCAHGQRLTSG